MLPFQTILPSDEELSNPEINRIISIVNEVEEKNNFLERFNADTNVNLPVGLIKQIGAARYVIAIDSMKFFSARRFF